MQRSPTTPNLSDRALDDHIEDLQAELNRLTICLELATSEKHRRGQRNIESQSTAKASPHPSDSTDEYSSKNELTIGSRVKILNKYKGNRGKIGTIVQLSSKTATVNIPREGNFIKYLRNLELLPPQDEK